MKMILKNKEKYKIDLFTKKNYFVFLISFFIVSIVIGIIFFVYINTKDKEILKSNITNYFTLNDNYNYLSLLWESLKNNFFTIILFWLLGISVVGGIIVLFLYFSEGFSLGFTIASIIYTYKYKGIVGAFLYLFPNKIIYIILIFFLTFFSLKFSYELIKSITSKEELNLNVKLKSYSKKLLFFIFIAILCSLLEIFISPLMIKAFTFLIK